MVKNQHTVPWQSGMQIPRYRDPLEGSQVDFLRARRLRLQNCIFWFKIRFMGQFLIPDIRVKSPTGACGALSRKRRGRWNHPRWWRSSWGCYRRRACGGVKKERWKSRPWYNYIFLKRSIWVELIFHSFIHLFIRSLFFCHCFTLDRFWTYCRNAEHDFGTPVRCRAPCTHTHSYPGSNFQIASESTSILLEAQEPWRNSKIRQLEVKI